MVTQMEKKALSSHQVTSKKPGSFGNAYRADCPTRLVLDRIGDKWAVLIVILLSHGTARFNELRREIEGISQKMLSQTLKSLERDGLVSREAFPTVPVTVEYSITPLGQTLAGLVDQVRLWANAHMRDVQAAQRDYDERQVNDHRGVMPRHSVPGFA